MREADMAVRWPLLHDAGSEEGLALVEFFQDHRL